MARQLLTWMAEHQGLPPGALLQCIDAERLENLEVRPKDREGIR